MGSNRTELCGNCHYLDERRKGNQDWICCRYPPSYEGCRRVMLGNWCGEWKLGERYDSRTAPDDRHQSTPSPAASPRRPDGSGTEKRNGD